MTYFVIYVLGCLFILFLVALFFKAEKKRAPVYSIERIIKGQKQYWMACVDGRPLELFLNGEAAPMTTSTKGAEYFKTEREAIECLRKYKNGEYKAFVKIINL